MPEKRFDIVTAGDLCPDLILTGDVSPVFGQVERLVDDAVMTLGGSSGIFACAAARLGLRVASIGRVGDDEFGHFMLRSLQREGVDISGVIVDPDQHTGLSVILARGSDRAILTHPGTIPTLSLDDIRPEMLAQARHLHVTSFYIQDALRPDLPHLFELAHALGLTTSLDTNYDPAETWDGGIKDVLARTDILLPNEIECCEIARLAPVEKAMAVLALQVPVVAVKQGANGALGCMSSRPGQVYRSNGLSIDVADTVGAGDTFDAGFLFGYLEGWEMGRALRLGTVCGSLSTRKTGGTTAQPTLEEASAYLEGFPSKVDWAKV